MDKFRHRIRRFRSKLEVPSCWKPKQEMPKLVYTVFDAESDTLLCERHVRSERRLSFLSSDRRVQDESLADLSWGSEREVDFWDCSNDSRAGPNVRIATFNVAFFSLAPALPSDYPSSSSVETPNTQTNASNGGHSSESSSIFSCVSKSSCSDSSTAGSGLVLGSNTKDASDSAVHVRTSKPNHFFNVWKFGTCNKSRGQKPNAAETLDGAFYNSKLNPVFSFSHRGSSWLVDTLPSLCTSSAVGARSGPPPAVEALSSHMQPSATSTEAKVSNFSEITFERIASSRKSKFHRPCFSDMDTYASLTPSDFSPYNKPPASTPWISTKAASSSALESTGGSWSILDVLQDVDADIIALQEVRAEEERGMKPLSDIAEALGMEYAYAESWAPEFGSAVLSRWPIKSASVQQLHDETDYRNVLKVVVDVPLAGDVYFYCTHLDHLDEDWRLKQVESLTKMIPPDEPHILAGNLNSLEVSDYSKDRWDEIVQVRKDNRKMPPRGDVMRKLLQEGGYLDSKLAIDGSTSSKGEQGTCLQGTRVDYILRSPKLPFEYIPGSYSVISSKGTSYHDVVVVDLQPARGP